MKKIIILGLGLFSLTAYSQVKTNLNVTQNSIPSQTPFLDASSSNTWNRTTNQGKGLVFPRTDLTKMTTLVAAPNGVPTSYPTRLDGMIVYNVGDGEAKTGIPVKVVEGFYYYYNKSNTLNGGTWKPLGGTSTSEKVHSGTFTSDGSAKAILTGLPKEASNIVSIKAYRTDAGAQKAVHTSLYSYSITDQEATVYFGSGVMSTSIPQGEYAYTIEYQ